MAWMPAPRIRFQSTLPVWGATPMVARSFPCLVISIHAPRVGSDDLVVNLPGLLFLFQSTLPVWGATWQYPGDSCVHTISIHAPRVGSDSETSFSASGAAVISIHAPRVGSDGRQITRRTLKLKFQSTLPVWGATASQLQGASHSRFQSTLPVWGATGSNSDFTKSFTISIHAPRVGSDLCQSAY